MGIGADRIGVSLDPRGVDAGRNKAAGERFDPRLLVGRYLALVEREQQPFGERQRPVGTVGREAFRGQHRDLLGGEARRSEEHTSELQSLMRISYAVFCLKKNKKSQLTT